MVSSLPDGWKFEQLISVGSNYQYGAEDQAEFLCVVSRDITESEEPGASAQSARAKVSSISKFFLSVRIWLSWDVYSSHFY